VSAVDGKGRFRVTADVGGTFTDVVVADAAGRLTVGKALTTQERIFSGLAAALASAGEQLGLDVDDLLASSDLFVFGTTRATNAIIERTTARTALLVTDGFPDILLRREGGKPNPFDFDESYPDAYVPRRLTLEIVERIDAEGEIVVPLDVEQTVDALGRLRARGVEAVGVCFLWSIVNPVHEQEVGRLIECELPGVPFTLSHRLNPTIREYRRASSTVIDASLKPLMQRHLQELERDLRDAGFAGELLAATSIGGVMHLADLTERPIYAVKSGPALAPVAGRTYAEAEVGAKEVIVCDTGGTSFDVSLVRGGHLVFTRETWLGTRLIGHLAGLSSVDVRSIGAGGGSIAWIDAGGLLRVGPQSAGADPGPACYGRGGASPTVTDAALLLGYLDPDYFLGGRMQLDVEAAKRAVGTLAADLRLPLHAAAEAILTVANEHMVAAIKEITINEGVDPRDSLIVAGGGAAGLNIVPIARELGCARVLVPRTAGALSACGGQYSDVVAEFTVSRFARSVEFDYAVNDSLEAIGAEIDAFSSALGSRGFERFETSYFVEAHYPFQVWDVEIPLPRDRVEDERDVEALVEEFHRAHERIFAVREPGQLVEFVNWKGRLTISLARPPLSRAEENGDVKQPLVRRIYFGEFGEVDAPIHEGHGMRVGAVLAGPAVIEEPTTTIVVYPGSSATVTDFGNYLLETG
jgi:N-methylhydantoinase A